jgi:hypothetical protein
MAKIKQNLKGAKDMKTIYADKKTIFRDFKVGGHVFLKVKEKRNSLRLGSFLMLAV